MPATSEEDAPPTAGRTPSAAPSHARCTVDLSVVIPFYNERENLGELVHRLRATLDGLDLRYELIFVDDGSVDDGVTILEALARQDFRIKVLVLSRNFGQHVAATAGLDFARGAAILWMDADLQERPEDIARFLASLHEGFDVVYGRRTRRRQSALRTLASHAYLRVLNRLAGYAVSDNRTFMRMFTAQVAGAMRSFEERNRFLRYLMPYAGFRSAEIEVTVDPRQRGSSKYSWTKLLLHGLGGLTSFSVAPLRLAAVFSCLTIAACGAGVTYVLYRYLVHGIAISGWPSLIIALLVLHALQFAVLAILGEYVGLVYTEAKRRPLYFCARAINLEPVPVAQAAAPQPAPASIREATARQAECIGPGGNARWHGRFEAHGSPEEAVERSPDGRAALPLESAVAEADRT